MAGTEAALTDLEAPDRRATIVGIPRYQLHLLLDEGDSKDSFTSVTRVAFEAVPGSSTFIDLDAKSISSVELNGKKLAPSAYSNGRISLTLLAATNELVVKAKCRYHQDGMGMQRSIDKEDGRTYLYTQGEAFEPHRIFACFDQPDIKGTFEISVTAPQSWEVVSNANLTAITPTPKLGHTTRVFATSKILPPYLATVVAGPFHKVEDNTYKIPLALYCRQSLAQYLDADVPELFDIAKRAIDFYESKFGTPYPFPKYAMAWVPDFTFGAMENPGINTFAEKTLFRGTVSATERDYRENTIDHEIAHSWFGDLVTMRWWNDLWLNESFATLMATLARDAAHPGSSNAAVDFAVGQKALATAADQRPSTHPVAQRIADTDLIWPNFDRITYQKGASVLRQLAAYVGLDAFFAGCATYFADKAWSNATLADFIGHIEKAAGVDLQNWSKLWLESAGINVLRPSFNVDSATGTFLSFKVEQSAAQAALPTLRPHRLVIGLYDFNKQGALVRVDRVEATVSGAVTDVPQLIGKKMPALVLVNDEDWTYAKVQLDPRSLQTAIGAVGAIKDPLARAVCNGALWEMVRDGEISASEYVDVVCQQAGESNPTVLELLLSRATTAAGYYADNSHIQGLYAQINRVSKDMIVKSDPDSAARRAWFDIYVSTASTQAELITLRNLLTGRVKIAGIAISDPSPMHEDRNARWAVVRRLASGGWLTEADIRAEGRRDPSNQGTVELEAALASLPNAAAKAAAWATLNGPINVARARALGYAFWSSGDPKLMAGYLAQMPALVEKWTAEREPVVLDNLLGYAFPTRISAEGQAICQAVLASANVNENVKRAIKDKSDDISRAIAARRVDRQASGPTGQSLAS